MESLTHQFTIGIDLGTTHCVMSCVDNHDENASIRVCDIPQLIDQGSVENLSQLGSFIYQAHPDEMDTSINQLPWQTEQTPLVGALARKLGSKTPIRLISSAKSWLCHSEINRRDAILPMGSPEEVEKLSPLKASEIYLSHLKSSWDNAHPETPFCEQHVTITVPASFDPAARDLTAEAAHNVGIKHLTLLEEPQAALYNWIDANPEWRNELSVGDVVLVVDIGGGTTDLSLVSVGEEDGNLSLNRIAVGEHILLGGDNMDLALAYRLKHKLSQEGKELQAWQIQSMVHACRDAKEELLKNKKLKSVPVVIPSRGSKLMGSTIKAELTQEEVQQTLVDGFFPPVSITDHPIVRQRSGLTKIGLPYAQDPAITKHIAYFLSKQANAQGQESAELAEGFQASDVNDFIKPNAVLLNGGVLKSDLLTDRLLDTINAWLTGNGAEPVKRLHGTDLDLAVASGAAYYGLSKQGKGVRIRGGIASAFYVGIESALPAIPGLPMPMDALCVAPFGMEEGSFVEVTNQTFGLVIGEPVQFQFFGSTTRRDDQAGEQLEDWSAEELSELAPIQLTLDVCKDKKQGDVVPVTLTAQVTELGTLRLEAIALDKSQKWHVEFDVRTQ